MPGNLPRVLPEGCGAVLNGGAWDMPPIFEVLRAAGKLSQRDMLRTFNCGLGMVLVVDEADADRVCAETQGSVVGRIASGEGVSWA